MSPSVHAVVVLLSWIVSFCSLSFTFSVLFLLNKELRSSFSQLQTFERNMTRLVDFTLSLPRRRTARYSGGYTAVLRPSFQGKLGSYAVVPNSLPQAPIDLKPPPFQSLYPGTWPGNEVPQEPSVLPAPSRTTSPAGSAPGTCKPCCTTGPPGPPGNNGRNGAPGHSGTPGAPGIPGKFPIFPCAEHSPALPPCPVCPPGLQGPQGPPGARGDDGLPGEPGSDGLNGIDGSPGPQGAKGLKGMQGSPGEKGNRGYSPDMDPPEQGPPGPPGPPGVSGPAGAPGSASFEFALPGPKGSRGPPGNPGHPGLPGALGPTGPPGAPGGPGICPTYCAVDGGAFHDPVQIVSNGNYRPASSGRR